MKRKRFTEEQIIRVLPEDEAGTKAGDLARTASIAPSGPTSSRALPMAASSPTSPRTKSTSSCSSPARTRRPSSPAPSNRAMPEIPAFEDFGESCFAATAPPATSASTGLPRTGFLYGGVSYVVLGTFLEGLS